MAKSKDAQPPGASFSAKLMFENLARGPTPVLTGIVKRADDDPSVVLFAPSSDCSNWIPISEERILRYEHLGRTAELGAPLVRGCSVVTVHFPAHADCGAEMAKP